MIVEWSKFKHDSHPLKIDADATDWIILVDVKGRLCFINDSVTYSMSKCDRHGYYALYRNERLVSKFKTYKDFVRQILEYFEEE